jgi:NitT/TauT family transport system substrate-binding protein
MKQWLYSCATTLAFLLSVACSKSEPAATKATAKPPEAATAAASPEALKAPAVAALRVAYSDWPGWVAWDIAVQKGWFKEAGVEIDFKWFDYAPSMDAYATGKVDAVTVTNGDALVTGSGGSPSVCILANDYSNGNDMLVAKPGIQKVADLKGKKIGVEVGFVDHLLVMQALKAANLKDKDVTLVNVPTDQTPQQLKAGGVDAIAGWQPHSGSALRELPGSKAIYTSADVPGLIYDHLCVNPKSLNERRADWVKVVKVWFKIADFIKEPSNLDEASRIMAARVGLSADEYKRLMKGTFFLDKAANIERYKKGAGLDSIYGSSAIVDDFNTKNGVYKAPVKFEEYFDASLVADAAK